MPKKRFMDTDRTYYLLEQYYHQRITAAEREELAQMVTDYDDEVLVEMLSKLMGNHQEVPQQLAGLDELQPYINEILAVDTTRPTDETAAIPPPAPRAIQRWMRWAAAAAVLVLIVSVYYYGSRQNTQGDATTAATTPIDVQPGQTGAVLTLSDGSKIVLDSLGNGIVKKQDGAIIEIKNGQVHYAAGGAGEATTTLYNTMTTAKGRQYQLVLADGTRVWLNAASSITYPVDFTGQERNVTVTGEAYFEVSKNPHRPFNVTVNNGATVVQVLGTHFNINAYADEPSITTTLLEGQVKISAYGQSKLLKVGQQAQTKAGEAKIDIENSADISSVVAWKDHYFSFTDTDLPTIMREVARWYDLSVVYRGKMPEGTYSGKIERKLTLRQVLNLLQADNIRYTIKPGNQIEIESL